MPSKTFVLLKHPLEVTSDDYIIGRFVSDPGNPDSDYAPRSLSDLDRALGPLDDPKSTTLDKSFRATAIFNAEANGLFKVAHLFGIGAGVGKGSKATVFGSKATITKIPQFRRVFNALVKEENIKRDLLTLLSENNGVAFFAVGALVITEGTMHILDENSRHIDATASINPHGEPNLAPAKIAIDGRYSATGSSERGWTGRKLCAVEYVKVRSPSFWNANDLRIGSKAYASQHSIYGDDSLQAGKNKIEGNDVELELLRFEPAAESWGAGILTDLSS